MKLKSGEDVVDRFNSHLHVDVNAILPEALEKIESQGRSFIVEEIQMGRIIGKTTCVVTKPDDQIIYAKRPKRFGYTRFVKNRQPEICSSVVVILKTADGEMDRGKYVLITAFVGGKSEPEPWDRNATNNSKKFWDEHALVWGSEPIIEGTEIATCPW